MKVLPRYSTIPEAIEWLSEQTKSQWTESKLLDFAASYGITLHAGAPISQSAGLYEIDHEGLRNKSNPKGLKRIHSTGWGMAEIFPIHIAQILHVGETETINAAGNADKQKGELSLFPEPVRVTREQLRISSNALHEFLRKFKQSPRHNQTAVSAAPSGTTESVEPLADPNDNDAKLPTPLCAIFRSMDNLHPKEVTFTFVGERGEAGLSVNSMISISARGETRRISLAEFGLADRRSNGAPNKQAGILLGMTRRNVIPRGENTAMYMSRLKKCFTEHLGLVANPFSNQGNRTGWHPLFTLEDKRGAADKRAEERGLRNTVEYNDELATHSGMSSKGDPAAEWLKKNDPNN